MPHPVKPRILVVEDEFLIAVTVQEMLEDLGCEVVGPVATLSDALEHCRSGAFDAAVLNLILQGKTAYSLAAVLRARNIPFGFASGVDRNHREDGWSDRPFLAKPYTAETIQEFLLEVLSDHILPAEASAD